MPVITNFQNGNVLYAQNLNSAFANTVNVSGDNITGSLSIQNIDILSGLIGAYNQANTANASVNNLANTSNLKIIKTQTTNTLYTLSLSDQTKTLTFNNITSTNVFVGNNLPIGFSVDILNLNSGNVIVSNATNVIINTKLTAANITNGSKGSLLCYAANTFILNTFN